MHIYTYNAIWALGVFVLGPKTLEPQVIGDPSLYLSSKAVAVFGKSIFIPVDATNL